MTQTMDTTRMWELPEITLPDEHRLFRATDYAIKRSFPRGFRPDDDLGTWAIADNSGATPDTTDDGILWLDFGSSIKLGKEDKSPVVPVISPDGKRHVCVTNPASLLIISSMFRWNINVYPGHIYRAIRL